MPKKTKVNPSAKPMIKKSDILGRGQTPWVYSKIVREHFFCPKNFLKPEEEKKFKYNAQGMVGSPACGDVIRFWLWIDPKTEKIKKCRWRTFGSLLPKQLILLNDYSTEYVENLKPKAEILDGDGNENIVVKTFRKKYTGKVITFILSTSNYYKLSVTPNHPMLVLERNKVAHVLRKRGKHWSEINQKKLEKANPILKPAAEVKKTDFLVFKITDKVKKNKFLTDDICKLLGYYVSDGFIKYNVTTFHFGLGEGKYIKEIANIAKKHKINFRIYKKGTDNVMCIALYDKKLVSILKEFGGGPKNKKFSDEIMMLPPHQQMFIVDKYLNGDGWVPKQKENWNEQYFISTSEEHLAYQLQMMLARNKIFAPIHKRIPRTFTIRGKNYKNNGEINLIFRKEKEYSRIKYHKKTNSFLIPIQRVVVDDYQGYVYDLNLMNEPKIYRVKGLSVHNCGAAIGSTSMLSVMITEKGGMKLEKARQIKPQDIIKRLGGLPEVKYHCSVLGDKALRSSINDYFRRSNQINRIVPEEGRIIDPVTKTTDKDIEMAVLEGADTLEKVQEKTKVGVANPKIIPEIEQLIRFYKEKYSI